MIRSRAHALFGCALLLTVSLQAAANVPAFAQDDAHSQLRFTGTQAGASFNGEFKRFTVKAQFDPAQPAASRIEVQIEVGSADTRDEERDQTLRGAEFFDVSNHPGAQYITRSIARTAAGYHALGTLTLRGVSRDMPIDFQFTPTPGGATLVGDGALKRLDFGVGQGEWRSTEWVGDEIKIHFTIGLKPMT